MSHTGLPHDAVFYPSSDDQPMAETAIHRRCMVDVADTLELWFRKHGRDDVYVGSNNFLYYCCFSLPLVGSPRKLVGLYRRRIAWEDGAIREPVGAVAVAFVMNRCCSSGEDVGARAASVGKGWASAQHLSMPCPHAP